MSDSPADFKSQQYEFTAEQNQTINNLAAAMEVVATLMKVAGLVFLVFFGLLLVQAFETQTNYGPVVGLAAAMLICLSMGFWTSGAARSFRRIVESDNRDIWHLMNALGKLEKMYSLLRTMIMGSLVVLVLGLALYAFNRLQG
ncbi:MAG: hypothetical protein KatS3mg105_2928 [Gemmatales bacterium]|nr:MAG: hypothetical protein KatS3mg105_2928 [Gemmatales bacterium]